MVRLASIWLLVLAHCAVDRSGYNFVDATAPDTGSLDSTVPVDVGLDAPEDTAPDAPFDVGVDATETPDAGPAHCTNGVRDVGEGETDVDCGGDCAPCRGCRTCGAGSDCASGECVSGVCRAVLSTVATAAGGTLPAYVDETGGVLLGRYPARFDGSGWNFDPLIAQRVGGSLPPSGWAPDPCLESGHLAWSQVSTAGREVELVCGRGDAAPTRFRSAIPELAAFGVTGTVGADAAGDGPGWVVLSRDGVGARRTGLCGPDAHTSGGGIAFCDGDPGSPWHGAHQASIFVHSTGHSLGCDGAGCSNEQCDIWLELWLR